LADSGLMLAVRNEQGVDYLPLNEAGVLQTDERRSVEHLPGPPLEVAFADRWSLIRTRHSVHLIGPDGVERWRRAFPDELVGSVDLHRFTKEGSSEGRLVAAIGRLNISHQPGRRGGQTDWGTAQGTVDVVDQEGRPLLDAHTFHTLRWNHDSPRVRILERSQRIVVLSGDLVLVSKPLFQGQ